MVAANERDAVSAVCHKNGRPVMYSVRHDRDLPAGCEHKGLSGQTVRADRRHDDVFVFRFDERSARRHGVSRRAGRRGDNDTVTVKACDRHVVAVCRDADAVHVPAVDDHVVEHGLRTDDPIVAHELHIKHHAAADRILSVCDLEQDIQLVVLQTGQKALAAEIHADDRDRMVAHLRGDVQNRPIAAHDDNESRVLCRFRKRLRRNVVRQIRLR